MEEINFLEFKLEFIDPMGDVTFLCPNKKVTKEVVRGEALRAKCILAPDPTPAAFDHRPLKMSRFSAGSTEETFRVSTMKAFKNRNIFECWMAMRRGIPKGWCSAQRIIFGCLPVASTQ